MAEPVRASATFRVLGAGGSGEIDPDAAPAVIDAQTIPKKGATGVPVSAFVQIVFSEPVKNLVEFTGGTLVQHVVLLDPENHPIPIKISGIAPDGSVVDDITSADAVVTGITVQPKTGLRYKTVYRLSLSDAIHDLDSDAEYPPTPKPLVPYETSFETFGPESLILPGEGATFGSPGLVALGDRGYLMDISAHLLRAFDLQDPVSPTEIESAQHYVPMTGRDIVGETPSPLGDRVVAVTTVPMGFDAPTATWLYNVSEDSQSVQIGGVTLLNSNAEGYVYRTFMASGVLYAATYKQGILVVDLGGVVDHNIAEGTSEYSRMFWAMTRAGSGWSTGSVVSIPVDSPLYGGPARLQDVKAALLTNGNDSRVFAVATGDTGLTVADPGAQSLEFNGPAILKADGGTGPELARLTYGTALALTNIQERDLAVVAGSGLVGGESRSLIMVVSLASARAPAGIGYVLGESGWVQDVVVKDDVAYVAYADHVMMRQPHRPQPAPHHRHHPQHRGAAGLWRERLASLRHGEVSVGWGYGARRGPDGGTGQPRMDRRSTTDESRGRRGW